jgi:AcrR family transcriptional regulator
MRPLVDRKKLEVATHYERRRRAVRERILAAAVERFEAHGVEGTKVDDICDLAQVAQKTFFNHFPSKQDLVREIAEFFLHDLIAIIEAARRRPGSMRQQLAHLFRRVAEEAEAAPPMRRTLIIEIIRLLHADPSRTEIAERLRGAFGTLLRDGVRTGEVTSAHPLPILAQVMAGAFYVLMLDWVSIPAFPVRARGSAMAKFLADALASRTPRSGPIAGSRQHLA